MSRKAILPIDECLFGKKSDSVVVSLAELRRIASQGIVDKGSHRGVAWRILLGYLPENREEWPLVLDQKRNHYSELIHEVFSSPVDNGNELRGHHGKRVAAAQRRKQQREEEEKQQRKEEKKHGEELEEKRNAGDVNDVLTKLAQLRKKREVERKQRGEEEGEGNVDIKSEDVGSLVKKLEDIAVTEEQNANDESNGETREAPKQSNGETHEALKHHVCPENFNESDEQEKVNSGPTTKDGSSSSHYVPQRIREQWKRSGRDSGVLVDMSYGVHCNTLLVVDNQGNAMSPCSRRNGDEDKWVLFYDNAALLDEIRKDVVRTHPDLYFFLEPKDNLGQRRYAAMERILFVWAKRNLGVRYVQGMNEIVGTLYFVLANDFNEEWAAHAEADTYFLFEVLMDEMRDVYVAALDDADTGIQGRIANMHSLLGLHDPEVCAHLEECGIHASFYAIRWLTTLLSREFLLPDTIRLWDSMFASTHKDNFLRYVCVTMVMLIREGLLKGDFSTCLRLLQSYPPTNLDALLESSRSLWIYESQITLACHKGGISLSQALTTISPPPSVVMAYGLVGGVAVRRSSAPVADPEVTGRAFLTGAKDFFGSLKRDVAKEMREVAKEVREAAKEVQARRNTNNTNTNK